MSYVTPLVIESYTSNQFLMGIIFSFSSLVGLIADPLIPFFFGKKDYRFFVILVFIFALIFPLVLLWLPTSTLVLLLAMATWGIYYEAMVFAKFNFVKEQMNSHQHALSWGVLSSFSSLSYTIGPILAGFFLASNFAHAYQIVIVLLILSFVAFLPNLKTKIDATRNQTTSKQEKRSFSQEIMAWGLLLKRTWPIYLFLTTLTILDATFWTIGPLLSEELRLIHPLGGLLLPLHIAPTLLVGLFTDKIARYAGKKKAAFFAALLSGLILFLSSFFYEVSIFLSLVFISSVAFAISLPEILAVFEDYVTRLKDNHNDMIGIQGSAGSLGYVLGPILAGFIASQIGNQLTFGAIGLLLSMVSLLCLLIVPKKIKMPQGELEAIV